MSYKTATVVLASAVASGGTITVGYPTGTTAGTFSGGKGHYMLALNSKFSVPDSATMSFGASNITVTYNGSTTIPAGSTVTFQFDAMGGGGLKAVPGNVYRTDALTPVAVKLGTPITADADGVCASQAITSAGTINGALATGGVATFDVPRNVVAAWTNTAVLTVTGTDEYGNVLKESSASGTSMTGKKAFKTVTAVASSASITGATVGTGDVLGLPFFLHQAGLITRELEDGALATAGTTVAGDNSVGTATTGDVRGTYDPNSACNGSKAFTLLVLTPDPSDRGRAQYAG